MVKEVAQQPGALALLSFSATKLWAARDTHFRRLTRQAYQAMGGVGGALAGQYNENASAVLAVGSYEMPLLYDTRTGLERVFPEPVRTGASSFATTGSGSDVWVGNNEGEVFLWPEKGPLRRKKVSKALVLSVQQSPDGKVLGVATFDQRVRLLNPETLEEMASGIGLMVTSMGFSADSKLMVIGDSSGQVQVWSVSAVSTH